MDDSSANLIAIISVLGGEFMSGRKYPEPGVVVGHLHDFLGHFIMGCMWPINKSDSIGTYWQKEWATNHNHSQ